MVVGAFESITIGGRSFKTKSDDNVNIVYTGKTNETVMHGDGTCHFKKTWHPGSIKGLNVIASDVADLRTLQDMQDKNEDLAVTATLAGGEIISGEVQIVNDLELNSGEGTIELELEGNVSEA